MHKLTTNVRLVILSMLVIVAATTYIGIYLPLKGELENTILINFALIAQTGMDAGRVPVSDPLIRNIEIHTINENQAQQILSSHMKYRRAENFNLVNEGGYTGCISAIPQTDNYFYARIRNDILFEPVHRISRMNLGSFAVGLIILFLITNFTTIKNIKNLIVRLEETKEKYRQYAIKDALTETYSRLFFQNWIADHPNRYSGVNPISAVIMIDLDGFKNINDTFGHFTGDKVLKKFANILKSSVREGDFVIRYGGDEFLIMLKECDAAFCRDIISRIQTKLSEIEEFAFDLEISYGVEEIQNRSGLLNHIENADTKMYHMKKQKQKQV